MKKVEDIAKNEGIWRYSTKDSIDVALKSKIYFRRNVKGYNFNNKLQNPKLSKLLESLAKEIMNNDLCSEYTVFDIEFLNDTERKIFEERDILERNSKTKYVILSDDERTYFRLGDEDHLILIINNPGYIFDDTFDMAERILGDIEKKFKYAFLPEFGYLTANPKNAGVGFQMVLTCHLVGLVTLGRLNDLISDLKRRGFTLSSGWINDYYSIYNDISLGFTEKELFDDANELFKEIINLEKKSRKEIFELNKDSIEDKVWRSIGILKSARMISLFEAFDLLSKIRFGVSLGIINKPNIKEINTLLYFIQEAHLLKRFGLSDDLNIKSNNYDTIIDESRANLLRNFLKEVA